MVSVFTGSVHGRRRVVNGGGWWMDRTAREHFEGAKATSMQIGVIL